MMPERARAEIRHIERWLQKLQLLLRIREQLLLQKIRQVRQSLQKLKIDVRAIDFDAQGECDHLYRELKQ